MGTTSENIFSFICLVIIALFFFRGCSCTEQDIELKSECQFEVTTRVWDRLVLGSIIYSNHDVKANCDTIDVVKEYEYEKAERVRKQWRKHD